jgi:hypothetical protein
MKTLMGVAGIFIVLVLGVQTGTAQKVKKVAPFK